MLYENLPLPVEGGGLIYTCPWREVLRDGVIQPINGEECVSWPFLCAIPDSTQKIPDSTQRASVWHLQHTLDEIYTAWSRAVPVGLCVPAMLHPGYLGNLSELHNPNFQHSGGRIYYGATVFEPPGKPENRLTTCMVLGLKAINGLPEPVVAISNINQFLSLARGPRRYEALCTAMNRDLAGVQATAPQGGRLILPHIPGGNRTVTKLMQGRGWEVTPHIDLPYKVNGLQAACMIGEWGDPQVPLDAALSLYQASGAVYAAACNDFAHGNLGLAAPPSAYAGPGLVGMAPECVLGSTLAEAQAACGMSRRQMHHFLSDYQTLYFGHFKRSAIGPATNRGEDRADVPLIPINPTNKGDFMYLTEYCHPYIGS